MAASLSFQPWTPDRNEEEPLKDILGRVNLERGHFRDITEASLQEEIVAEGALELSESEDEDDEEAAGDTQNGQAQGKAQSREDLYKAKYEMLGNVRAAEQDILLSLDFVSLLLSKDAPKQAQTTISPFLKDNVPTGSLGADLWKRMPVDKVREAQDELLATNVRMEGLQQGADDLLAAASRFQDNVRKETQYWDQILSISERGWNVCRIPGQQHRLGVRFGLSESTSEFSRRGIAALNPSEDGTIALERGIGSKPKAVRATLRKNGQIVGVSRLPDIKDPEETTLEARIRYARDSLFDEELYREMVRESRTLIPLGVNMDGAAIQFHPQLCDIQVSLDLVSLDEQHSLQENVAREEDNLAQAIALAARLLLSRAHRDRLKKRSEIPPPMSDKPKEENNVLPILRPIMSFVMHHSALEHLNAYLNAAKQTLNAAHIDNHCELALFRIGDGAEMTTTEGLVATLMQPLTSEATLQIKIPEGSNLTFSLSTETTLAYGFGSKYTLRVPGRQDGYQIDDIDDLVTASSSLIASALAKALMPKVGDDWSCNEQEALLVKDGGAEEKDQCMWVSLDVDQKALSLNSLVKKILWKVEDDSSQTVFWDAKSDLLEGSK